MSTEIAPNEQSTSFNVSDVVKAFEETIKVLSTKMKESGEAQSWPGVFPTGINSVSIIVKVGGTDIEIKVSGPDPKA